MAELSIASVKRNAKDPAAQYQRQIESWPKLPKKFLGIGDQKWIEDVDAKRWRFVSGTRDLGERGLITDLRKKVDEVVEPKRPLVVGDRSVNRAQFIDFGGPLGAVLWSANDTDYGWPTYFDYTIYNWDQGGVNAIIFEDIRYYAPIIEFSSTPAGWEPVWAPHPAFGWICRDYAALVLQGQQLGGFQFRSTEANTGYFLYALTSIWDADQRTPGPATVGWAIGPIP